VVGLDWWGEDRHFVLLVLGCVVVLGMDWAGVVPGLA
jgi:hypothetical protein